MKVLMLLDNSFRGDPRVGREIKSLLEAGYEIDLFCLKDNSMPTEESEGDLNIYRIIKPSIFNVKDSSYVSVISTTIQSKILKSQEIQYIHCHDHHMLHLGIFLKKAFPNAKVIYDAHELFFSYPIVNIPKWRNPWLYIKSKVVRSIQIKRERKNIKKVDAVITVNDSIAKLLEEFHQLSSLPYVVRNIPAITNPNSNSKYFRDKFGIADQQAILIFITGRIQPVGHNLNQVISEMGKLKNVALVITGDGPGKMALLDKCNKRNFSNIYFHEPVAPNEIINHLSCADFGLLPFWNKKDLSFWYALPNKLFEYVMAEIPILSTAQPEYKKVILEHELGVVVNPDVSGGFKTGIQQLISKKEQFVKNLKTAKEELNWEKEKGKLLNLYSALNHE